MRTILGVTAALVLFIGSAAAQTKPVAPSAKPRPRAAQPVPAQPPSKHSALPTKELVDSFMHRMFGYDPALKWNVVSISPSEVKGIAHVVVAIGTPGRATHLFVSADHEWAIVGDVLPFGKDPFVKVRRQLEERATGPAKGPKDAPITIVEFTDLQCPSCKAAEPTLQKLLAEIPNVRFVVQQFPLTQIHPWAMRAGTWAHCIGEKDPAAYFKFADAVFEKQSTISEANLLEQLRAAATAAGADPAATETCAQEPATEAAVRASIELGRSVGVAGTPTIFVNGRKLAGINNMPYDSLKAIVQFELEQAQKPAAASPGN